MILDAYVNTLFPQEKQKSNFIYLISSSIPVFFLQIWFIEIWIVNALYGDINFSLHVFFLPRCHR